VEEALTWNKPRWESILCFTLAFWFLISKVIYKFIISDDTGDGRFKWDDLCDTVEFT